MTPTRLNRSLETRLRNWADGSCTNSPASTCERRAWRADDPQAQSTTHQQITRKKTKQRVHRRKKNTVDVAITPTSRLTGERPPRVQELRPHHRWSSATWRRQFPLSFSSYWPVRTISFLLETFNPAGAAATATWSIGTELVCHNLNE